jgi:Lamin Tail Domain
VDTVNPAPSSQGITSLTTPDAVNSVAAALPPFAPLWINEVEPINVTGITNGAGQHVPWVELYNPSTNKVALTNLWLSPNYTDLTAWAFPTGATINPGQFLVIFADGQTNLSTTSELHTSFSLSSSNGSIALSRAFNGQPQVLDYVNYGRLQPDWSYGSIPDGQSFVRQAFYSPTPGGTNGNGGGPPSSSIAYNIAGSTYTQSFDSLPDPGVTSVNSANPVTIDGVTYSLANPYDFAFPAMTNGSSGGLGLASLAGWYGSSSLLSRFGATDGDQTTGGQISFGLPNDGNRALGLLATSTTGTTAFGAKIINNTHETLNFITVLATGELWRQSSLPKTLQCFYAIDPTATAPMPSQATASLPALNVIFPTDAGAAGGVAVDGTAAANQSVITTTNQAITNWTAGAALWLVWQMTDPTGKAQGLGIDNFSFSAIATLPGTTNTPPTLTIQTSPANAFVISWPDSGGNYQLFSTTNLAPPVIWTVVSGQSETNGTFYLPIAPTNAGQFFRLSGPP